MRLQAALHIELACVLWLCLSGCTVPRSYEGRECSEIVGTFFQGPVKSTIIEFSKLSVEDKYPLYICGNQFMRPPAQYLAEPFALEGGKAVGFLKGKLSQTHDDLTIRDIILVFNRMSRRQSYDVARDTELLKVMTDSVDRMKSDTWRTVTRQMLDEIRM